METILFNIGTVATIKLNRPQVRNAFDPKMISEMTEVMRKLSQETQVRCVLITGEGRSFCAGADLEWMRSMAQFTEAENLNDSQKLYEMFAAIKSCPVPVIVGVQGHAMGGALGLLAAADIVIADEKSEFCFSEAKLGLAPAVISAFVKDKISASAMNHLFLTARAFTAPVALSVGLIHEICESSNLSAVLQQTTEQICSNGPLAVRATKKLIRDIANLQGVELKKSTTELIAQLRVSPEGQEGIQSFLQRRDPAWRTHA